MSDIRFNQWLHQSGTGGITQVDGGHVGIGTTNPDVAVHTANNKKVNVGIVTANSVYAGNFYGSGANLTGITGTTINNNAANKVIMGSNTANTLEAVAKSSLFGNLSHGQNFLNDQNLIFGDASDMILIHNQSTNRSRIRNTNDSGSLDIESSLTRFLNKDGSTEKLRIDSNGRLMVNQTAQQGSTSKLEVTGTLNNSYPQYSFPLMINDDAAYNSSAGPGGGVGFSFKQNSGGAYAQAGGIRGIKENTTDGNYASALTFYTRPNGGGTAERMRISSAGYVTKPAHPSFLAGRTGGNQTFTVGTFPLNVARVNVGNHYNTSTYKFVAPVAGVYYFFAQVYYNNGSGAYRVGFRKTPSGGSAFMLNTASHEIVGNDDHIPISIVESMGVGDAVELYSDQNASLQCYYNMNDTTYGAHTYFGGYLIG